MEQAKQQDTEIELCVPCTKGNFGHTRHLWVEGWGKIQHHLSERISPHWKSQFALYSSVNDVVKSKQDFIDVVSGTFDGKKHEMKQNDDNKDSQHIFFVVKVK